MTHFNRSRQNKRISNLSVDSEVLFVVYACFTISYSYIGHYVGNYVDIINQLFGWLFSQANLREMFLHTNIIYLEASTDVKSQPFFWWKMGGWSCGSWNGPLNCIRYHKIWYW